MAVTACSEKKKSEDILVAKYVPEQLKDPIRMPLDERHTSVEWMGEKYVVNLLRQSVDSLPSITDETGQQYYDNRVVLTISRPDQSVFFKKVFVKGSFASFIDGNLIKAGMLENIVYHGIEDNNLKFGVVVSRAGNEDEFIPLDLAIDCKGGMSIKLGKLFDSIDEGDSNN
jgi:hypothetical protein